MRKLKDIFPVCGSDIECQDIRTNSRDVQKGDLFICTRGITADRHAFVDDAIARGASAVIACRDIGPKSVPVIYVEDTDEAMAYIAQKFYGCPDEKMTMIGVTGTDGKTSTASIIQTLIGDDKCGYIGTNGVLCRGYEDQAANTTPDADVLYRFLSEFCRRGCRYVTMECSSEALMRGRIKTVAYDAAVFTNLTSEHINIHGTLENYRRDKARLFEQTKKDGFCVINADDQSGTFMIDHSNGKAVTYGKDPSCTLFIKEYAIEKTRTLITYVYKGETWEIASPLLGEFNVYNLAGALLALLSLGFDRKTLQERVKLLAVDGRVTMIPTGGDYYVMVDYAHTPNGISNILKLVDIFGFDRVVVVIGAAGTRDPYKRPLMGKTICAHPKTYAVFTYEDPRNEDPADIAEDLTRDIKDLDNWEIVLDRRAAIAKAIGLLGKNECALILGKGNETEEILKDGPIYFNDIEEAKAAIASKRAKTIKTG